LLLYGEQRANAGIAGELELDGYQVHRASHAGTLRARFNSGEVDLVADAEPATAWIIERDRLIQVGA
jgi:hypothetical protein